MPPSTGIALLLLGVLLLETRRSVRALLIQQAFGTHNHTNNFVVDPVSRKVYLATVNSVYQLNGTLTLEVEERTGPVEDNLLCHAPQLPQAPCEHPKSLTDNHNKLLKLDRDQKVLVVCGSVYQGFCELRKMDNISEIAVEFPPKGEKTVFPSMLNIAANHPNASTVGLIFKSHDGSTRLLVGATYTGAGTQFFPKNHSKEDLRFENTPEIAIRSLNIKDLSRLFTYDINPSEDNVFKIKQEVKTKNKLNFVRAFMEKTYSYIAFNNDAKMGHKESQPNSILSRICLDTDQPRKSTGPDSRKLTESYIQMPLQCGLNGNIYNRLVSVYSAEIPEPYLFGVFSKADRKSALCAFKFGHIEDEIRQARKNCSNSPSSDVQVLDSVIQGSGAACIQKENLVEALEACQTRISKMELQQQQQQVVQLEGLENATARTLLGKLINVLLALMAVLLVFVSTVANCVVPLMKTRSRSLSTLLFILLLAFLWRNWDAVSSYTHLALQRPG